MTITQTVEIPADRRVFFEFLAPLDIPEGKAQVEVKVIPFVKKEDKPDNKGKFPMSKSELDTLLQNAKTTNW